MRATTTYILVHTYHCIYKIDTTIDSHEPGTHGPRREENNLKTRLPRMAIIAHPSLGGVQAGPLAVCWPLAMGAFVPLPRKSEVN